MANKWEGNKPVIVNIQVPEIKKIKQPSKYYVYKLVVEWSDGHKETIYRRYSQFFDFQAKLVEQFETTENLAALLPDLPSKILFGRSQVHQVAEKRRGKIQEFCQAVYKSPPAVSESSLVQGFFSIWPDDKSTIGDSVMASGRSNSQGLISPSDSIGSLSPSPVMSPEYETSDSFDIPMSEDLPQYKVTENYTKMDSQQVNLTEGQVVSVIERFDTGWWMVLCDDGDQGYAPASLLESVDGSLNSDDEEQDEKDLLSEGIYEAIGDYKARNQDEVTIKQGDTFEVVNRSMDGWWEINAGGKTGFVPGSMMKKSSMLKMMSTLPRASQIYCSDLPVFNPPPRRHKAGKTVDGLYDIPRRDILAVKTSTSRLKEGSSGDEDSRAIYAVPRPSLSDEPGDTVNIEPNVNTSERNKKILPKSVNDTVAKVRSTSPQMQNGNVEKQPPLTPRKMMVKSESDHIIASPINRASATTDSRSRSYTAAQLSRAKVEEEDYIQMHTSTSTTPEPTKPITDIFATGPRRKKPALPSKPSSAVKKRETSNATTTQLSPLLRRMSRCHSFDNILNLDSNDSWSSPVEDKPSPKTPRHALFGNIHTNTNSSNNSKISSDDQTDYVDLEKTMRTYVAVASYTAQTDACIGFNAGDRCVLLNTTNERWWLVNIGGKEGWVPGTFWDASTKHTASKLANPPNFSPPERPEEHSVYSNQSVYKRPLTHTVSTPAPEKPERRKPPPKPKALPANLAAEIISVGRSRVCSPDDIISTTPTRFVSKQTSEGDIIPITTMTVKPEYENDNDLVSSFQDKPAVPQRGRSGDLSPLNTYDKKPMIHRGRAETVADVFSAPAPKPRGPMSPPHRRQHDYEEIHDELEQQPWYYGPMDRESAESLLKEYGRQSEFLIRARLNKVGYYALSIKNHLSVRHFNIDPDPSSNSYIMGSMKFQNIFEIIRYYQDNSLFLQNGFAVSLGQPVKKRLRAESYVRKH